MEEGTAAQKSPVSPRELIAKGVESVIIVLLIAALIHIIENYRVETLARQREVGT